MATIEKVKEGLFIITWINANVCNNTTCTTKFKIDEILRHFNCKLYSIHNGTEYLLAMEITFINRYETIFPEEFETVWASKDGTQQQKMVKSNKLISHNGSCTKDNWQSKWTGPSRSKCVNCQSCTTSSESVFRIVIELPSYSVDSMKTQERLKCVHKAIHLMRENQTFTDVTFKFKDKTVKSHSSLLIACSPVFSTMFEHDFKEKGDKIVHIEDIEPTVFEQLVQYLYIQDADFENVDVAGLFIAADKYGIDLLKEECVIHLSQNLDSENAIRYLVLAHLHKAPKLYQLALDFMASNAKAICSRDGEWMDMIKNYPELTFEVTKRMTANL